MPTIRFSTIGQPIPWSTRILMILGGVIVLSLLFFFAFTFFVVGAIATGLILIVQLFLGKTKSQVPKPPSSVYRAPRRDDDVIDI